MSARLLAWLLVAWLAVVGDSERPVNSGRAAGARPRLIPPGARPASPGARQALRLGPVRWTRGPVPLRRFAHPAWCARPCVASSLQGHTVELEHERVIARLPLQETRLFGREPVARIDLIQIDELPRDERPEGARITLDLDGVTSLTADEADAIADALREGARLLREGAPAASR